MGHYEALVNTSGRVHFSSPGLSLHLSKCRFVGNHMLGLIWRTTLHNAISNEHVF